MRAKVFVLTHDACTGRELQSEKFESARFGKTGNLVRRPDSYLVGCRDEAFKKPASVVEYIDDVNSAFRQRSTEIIRFRQKKLENTAFSPKLPKLGIPDGMSKDGPKSALSDIRYAALI